MEVAIAMLALRYHYRAYICMALILAICVASLVVTAVYPSSPLNVNVSGKWGIVTVLVAILAVLAFYFEFENIAQSAKEIALVSMLGTVSAVVRIPFAPVPGVQPSTFLIICSGYVFGPVAGFMVGAMTPIVSNFFLGHGPWTLFQVFAWGLIGFMAGYVGKVNLSGKSLMVVLVGFGIVSAYLFGALTNLFYWTSFDYPLTLRTFMARETLSFWFDTFHAIGNVLFLWFLGTRTISILERFRKRFRVFYGVPTGHDELPQASSTEPLV